MKYRYGLSPGVALAALVVALVGAQAAAQQKPVWIVRYTILTATPLAGTPKDVSPPIYDQLQRGRGPALKADPAPFLATLRQDDDRFEYRVTLSGKAEVGANGECCINTGPLPNDPEEFTYTDFFKIQGAGPNLVDIYQEGKIQFSHPNGRKAQEWKCTRAGYELGKTYIQGAIIEGRSGRHVSLAVCIYAADDPEVRSQTDPTPSGLPSCGSRKGAPI